MKRTTKVIGMALAAVLMGCADRSRPEAAGTAEPTDSLSIEVDSMAVSMTLTLEGVPEDTLLQRGLAAFVSSQLFFEDEDGNISQPEYAGDLSAFLQACAQQKWKELKSATFASDEEVAGNSEIPTAEELVATMTDENGEKTYLSVGSIHLRKAYETDEVVTWTAESEYNLGASRPSLSAAGITLRKADGQPMTAAELLGDTDSPAFRQQLKEAVRLWVKDTLDMPADTDEQLKKLVTDNRDVDNLPLPERAPYLTEDGIILPYQGDELIFTHEPQVITVKRQP